MRERWLRMSAPGTGRPTTTRSSVGCLGDLPVDRITEPLLAEFTDLLQRCPRIVPHAIRRASLKGRLAWGEKPADLRELRLARRTMDAKGLDSISAALTIAEKLGHIAVDPCPKTGLTIAEADVVRREPYSRNYPRGAEFG